MHLQFKQYQKPMQDILDWGVQHFVETEFSLTSQEGGRLIGSLARNRHILAVWCDGYVNFISWVFYSFDVREQCN